MFCFWTGNHVDFTILSHLWGSQSFYPAQRDKHMSSELWDLSLWSGPRPMWLGFGSRRKFYKQIVLTVQHGSSFAEFCKNRHQDGPGIIICLTLTHSRHRMSSEFWSINSLLLTLCEHGPMFWLSLVHTPTTVLPPVCSICSHSLHCASAAIGTQGSYLIPYTGHGSDNPWEWLLLSPLRAFKTIAVQSLYPFLMDGLLLPPINMVMACWDQYFLCKWDRSFHSPTGSSLILLTGSAWRVAVWSTLK